MTDEERFRTPEEHLGAAVDSVERGADLSSEALGALSHLDARGRQAFERGWLALDPEGRARLLGQLHASEADDLRQDFNPIYQLALDDPDPNVRRRAIEAIIEDPGVTLLDKLSRLAAEDPDVGVREAACRALAPFALMGELGQLSPERTEVLRETLLAVLRREGEGVGARGEALAAVGYIPDDRVGEEIRRALARPELRLSAIRAIGRTANSDWLSTLTREAANADARLREEVARACGEMADQRAVSLVIDLLEDPALAVRLAAIEALGQIGGEEARDALIYALEDKRKAIRDAAAAALAELDFDEDPLAL